DRNEGGQGDQSVPGDGDKGVPGDEGVPGDGDQGGPGHQGDQGVPEDQGVPGDGEQGGPGDEDQCGHGDEHEDDARDGDEGVPGDGNEGGQGDQGFTLQLGYPSELLLQLQDFPLQHILSSSRWKGLGGSGSGTPLHQPKAASLGLGAAVFPARSRPPTCQQCPSPYQLPPAVVPLPVGFGEGLIGDSQGLLQLCQCHRAVPRHGRAHGRLAEHHSQSYRQRHDSHPEGHHHAGLPSSLGQGHPVQSTVLHPACSGEKSHLTERGLDVHLKIELFRFLEGGTFQEIMWSRSAKHRRKPNDLQAGTVWLLAPALYRQLR
ncbi:PREDICTED: collagen alpha-1(II) chain-like, partial [Chlamydotis macqueenii]|uniref:collagen alpha-1(II) chain-like n=1 Tax=Chlamydotis macqueenii TaxID=187382 RepID=UPI00052A1111